MNIKAMLPILVAVIVGLAAWEMFLKKTLIKSSYEDEDFEED